MHLGSARTALYAFLVARRSRGQFILRIEDTDQKRYVEGTEEELINGLRWLGIHYDEGPDIGGPAAPYRQTERRETYQRYAWQLVESGHAFPCFCTSERLTQVRQEQQKAKQNPRYDGHCRNLDLAEAKKRVDAGEKFVVRFKMPKEGSTTGVDLLRGPITVENKDLDDTVLLKSDGLPTYHLAAMVDDHEMKVTHVIRGSEWLSTFPLHVNIIHAFGWQEPAWIHLSVFLKPSGKGKMSKREAVDAIKDGHSIFISDLEQLGYIPEGVLNWIVLMGWGVAENEVMSLNEMIDRFDIANVNPSPAAIDFAKLDHFNGTHIRLLAYDDLAQRVKPVFEDAGYAVDDDVLLKIIPLIRERLVTLDDCIQFGGFFFKDDVRPSREDLIPKKMTADEAAAVARKELKILEDLPGLDHDVVEPILRDLVEELGLKAGQVFGIMRVAVTGQTVSPPLFESMAVIGREKVLERMRNAVNILEQG